MFGIKKLTQNSENAQFFLDITQMIFNGVKKSLEEVQFGKNINFTSHIMKFHNSLHSIEPDSFKTDVVCNP